MAFNPTHYSTAVQICQQQFGIDDPEEHAFLVLAVYKSISIRQIEKRLQEVVTAFKTGASPPAASFAMDDFLNAKNACASKLGINNYKEHPFVAVAMYEAIGFRQIEERMEELIIEARKVRRELNSLENRVT